MKIKKLIVIIICICFAMLLFGMSIYVLNFYDNKLSDEVADWAQFGDYFGGVLNPILSLINICIFIYLTLVVQNISNNNHVQALEMNKKIALMSMKREELNHFKLEMDKVISDWEEDLTNIEKVKKMLYKYNVLEYRMGYLFPNMYSSDVNQKFRRDLVESLDKLQNNKEFQTGPSVNVYGMLISKLSEMVVE